VKRSGHAGFPAHIPGIWMRLALALLAVFGAPAACAAEIDYAVLFRVLDTANGIERYERLRAVQRIESKQAGVNPDDIRITVMASAGEIVVPVAADGQLQFPLSQALLGENPKVSTNQPQGSLTLTLSIELALPSGARIPAADIRAALDQVDAMFAERGEGAPPRARGAEFYFADAANAGLTLRGESERLLLPDGAGRVILMRDSDLAPGTLEVEVAAAPSQVLPFFGR